jgi:hypothetical protein
MLTSRLVIYFDDKFTKACNKERAQSIRACRWISKNKLKKNIPSLLPRVKLYFHPVKIYL